MPRDAESYVCSTSPVRTFGYETLAGRRPPRDQAARRAVVPASYRARDPRKPLSLDVRYLGAGQDVWEIRTRGVRWKFSGAAVVGDILRWINSLPGY